MMVVEQHLGVVGLHRIAVLDVWRRLALPDDRVLVREAAEEAAHLDDQVGQDRQVGQRLDGDLRPVILDGAHACQLLASVHLHPAGAARRVQARMAQSQGRVAVELDPAQGVEHGRVRVHGDVELIEVLGTVSPLVAVHAQPADVGPVRHAAAAV
jgi:hypothetical protein